MFQASISHPTITTTFLSTSRSSFQSSYPYPVDELEEDLLQLHQILLAAKDRHADALVTLERRGKGLLLKQKQWEVETEIRMLIGEKEGEIEAWHQNVESGYHWSE